MTGIFYASFAFEEGLNEITDYCGNTENHAENDGMFPIHPEHFVAQKMGEDEAGERRDDDCASEAFPGFAGADAGNHFMLTNQRADCVRAGIAEFGDEHEVKQVVMPLHFWKEVYFLNEI